MKHVSEKKKTPWNIMELRCDHICGFEGFLGPMREECRKKRPGTFRVSEEKSVLREEGGRWSSQEETQAGLRQLI